MIRYDMPQGSDEWLRARLGIPTASEFHKIVTPTGKLSTQARKYAVYLTTEKLLNRSLDSLQNLEWIERGKALEPEAVRAYEFQEDIQTEAVGFITDDRGHMGCSPDRLIVGENAAIEIKCLAPHTHVGLLLDGPGVDYRAQVQGQILVGGFDYVDFFAYSDEMPPVKIRTYPDEAYLAVLAPALDQFCTELADMIETVRSRGLFTERARFQSTVDELGRLP